MIALFLPAALVPGVATQVVTFQIVNSFGLFGTRWAPIALYPGTDMPSQDLGAISTSLFRFRGPYGAQRLHARSDEVRGLLSRSRARITR